jgi:hypothetical protein
MTEPPQEFFDEARIRKHNTESVQYHNIEVQVKLLDISFMY